MDSVLVKINNVNYTMVPDLILNGTSNLFYDGFESGILTSNWTTSGAGVAWAISTVAPYAGTYLIQTENTDGESAIETTIDATNHVNITFSFYYETNALDAGEYIAADWYNGTAWINLLTVEDTAGWIVYNSTLPASANDNSNLGIRFRCYSVQNDEECKVDDVQVTGTDLVPSGIYRNSYNTSSLPGYFHYYTVYASDIYNNYATPMTGNFSIYQDAISPTWSNNKTNASYLTRNQETVYFNVTLTDNLAGGHQKFYFYNGVSWIADAAQSWTSPEELNEIRTITAIRNQTIKWYWWFNDSLGNVNQTDTWNFTVANTPPILTANPSINNSIPKTNNTIMCNPGTYYDVDADPEGTMYWLWYENDLLIPGQTTQTLDLNLPGFIKGDNITCSEKTSDGYDNSSWYNSTTVTIQNTPPTITGTIPGQNVNNSMTWSYDANATDPDVDEGIDTLTWYDDSALFDIVPATGIFSDTPIESEAGIYIVLINVSDGTDDDTQTFIYAINDIVPPTVTLEYPLEGFYYDLAPTYNVDFNCSATDGYNLKNISLWITASNNQSFDLAESSIITGTYDYATWTVNLEKGNYTWSCLANDYYNNTDWGINRTLKINFTYDLIIPVINWINDSPDPVNRGQNITFLANVTDNLGIDSVWVEIEDTNHTMWPRSYYNGTTQYFFDDFESGSLATNNWTTSGAGTPWVPSTTLPYAGTYSTRVENTNGESILENVVSTIDYVNNTLSFYYDTLGLDIGEYFAADWYNGTAWINIVNVQTTAGWTLSVTSLPSSADDNPNLRIRFRCSSNNNNEDCRVDDVQVNGTERLYTDVYEYNYNTTQLDNGTYNYTVYARDTYDNDAVPYSGNFTVIWNDYKAPNVFGLIPIANDNFTSTYTIEIGANVTDDGFIHTVLANITFPNGTLQQITLSNVIGDKYNTSFTIPPIYGRYNVTFIANDTANNVNNTETTYFNGVYVDVTPPTSDSPPDQEVDIGEDSTISWNLDDDTYPGDYYVERNGQLFKGPTAWQNGTPVIVAANNYFPGVWNYTIFFNDSTGNYGNPDTVLVTVNDTTIPSCDDVEGDIPVLVNITIDGNMDDWDGVRVNDKNFVSDPTEGAGDLDTGMTADRDLVEFAFTWNPETLYFYFRRLNSGTNVITMLVYMDYDNDGYMNTTDQVMLFTWWGSNQKYNAELYDYTPAGTADYMNGSGHTLPGTISPSATIESQIIGGADTGIELETRVDWSDLGLSEPTAINYQAASSLGTNLPNQIQDNINTINSIYGLLLFQPDHTSSTKNGTSLYYDHDLMNCGVLEELIELTNQSSEGFPLTLYYQNGSVIPDSNGNGNPDVYLKPNNYTTIIAKIDVPGSTALYTTDITTITATSSVDETISEAVTDITSVGVISITPYQRETSVTPGTTLTLNYTVSNYQELSDTIEIDATSSEGWN
ncbi:hypothetical protein ACFLZ6_01500, partial [Nanoarchaeota archaeon]